MRFSIVVILSAVTVLPGFSAYERGTPTASKPEVICHLRQLKPGPKERRGAQYVVTNNGGYRFEWYDKWATSGEPVHGVTNSGILPLKIVNRLVALAIASQNEPPQSRWQREGSTTVFRWYVLDEANCEVEVHDVLSAVAEQGNSPYRRCNN